MFSYLLKWQFLRINYGEQNSHNNTFRIKLKCLGGLIAETEELGSKSGSL